MSLIDLSNKTLSGCCVSLVIGFSYFLRLKPHEDASSTIATLAPIMSRFEKPNIENLANTRLERRRRPWRASAWPGKRPRDSQCEIQTTPPPPTQFLLR